MSYFLYSQIQKKNTNRNMKIFNKYIRGQDLNKEKIISRYKLDTIVDNNKIIAGEKYIKDIRIKNNYNNKNFSINSLDLLKSSNNNRNKELDMSDLYHTKKKCSKYIKTLFKSFYLVSSFEERKLSDLQKNKDNIDKIKEFILKLSKKLDEIKKKKKILLKIYRAKQ